MLSERQIERLIIYRREIRELLATKGEQAFISSVELGEAAGCPPHLVRKDFSAIEYRGLPRCGYDPQKLLQSLDDFLGPQDVVPVGLVGLGNLGIALLRFFSKRCDGFEIRAVFDCAPTKIGRTVGGYRCWPIADFVAVARDFPLRLGVITVPEGVAQHVSDILVSGDIRGILNFAPVILRVPRGVVVQNVDISLFLEKLATMALQLPLQQETLI